MPHRALPACVCAALLLLPACGAVAGAGGRTVTLFAAASTAHAMQRETAAFENAHPNVHVDGDYEGTQSLLTKLEADPSSADVLLSADTRHMDDAARRGLVTSPRDLVSNRLVVAVPQGNPARISSLADLARPGVRLVLADPSVPAGSYAEQALRTAEQRHDEPAGFASAVLGNVVSRESDVEQVVAKVASGEVDAGIVYATDARAEHRITAVAIPVADQPSAVYPVAVTRASPDAADARVLVDFLLSAAGIAILVGDGFTPAGTSP